MASKGKRARAKPDKGSRSATPKLSTGFALMSLVPILLTLYLVSRPQGAGDPLGGRQGIVLGLMMASAISGFLFIKSELARILEDVVDRASRGAAGDLKTQLREISRDEISRITGTIEQLTTRFESGPEPSDRVKERLRAGLASVAEAIQSSRDTQRLVELFTECAKDAVDAKTAYFVGIDEEEGDFVTRYACGAAADDIRQRRIPLGEGVPGLAARERAPIVLHDLDQKGKAGLGLTVAPESTIASPLHIGESLYGVLILHDRTEGGRFEEDDVAVVASLCILAASAMSQRATSERLDDSLDEVIYAFSRAIENRDPYSRGHTERVALYCEEMARALKLDEETVRSLRRAAYLHGVGRIKLPETLLRKDGEFTEEELEHYRAYPVNSAEIIQDVAALAAIAPMVKHHLERPDGTGVPDGMGGDDIPLTTHILIVANAFDVMTSDQSYRQACSLPEAFRRLKEGTGTLYDRRAVRALMELDEKVLKGSSRPRGNAGAVKGQGTASISVLE